MMIFLAQLCKKLHQVFKVVVIALRQLIEDVENGRFSMLVVGYLRDSHEVFVMLKREQWLGKTSKIRFKD